MLELIAIEIASGRFWSHSQIIPSEALWLLMLQVYDATSFLKEHPGGGDSILLVAGTDATEEFDAIHSEKAKKQLLSFAIGRLATTPVGE